MAGNTGPPRRFSIKRHAISMFLCGIRFPDLGIVRMDELMVWGTLNCKKRREPRRALFLLAITRGLFCGVFDVLPLRCRELDRGRGDVLFEVLDRGGAGDREHDGRTMEEPGERELRDGGSVSFGD